MSSPDSRNQKNHNDNDIIQGPITKQTHRNGCARAELHGFRDGKNNDERFVNEREDEWMPGCAGQLDEAAWEEVWGKVWDY